MSLVELHKRALDKYLHWGSHYSKTVIVIVVQYNSCEELSLQLAAASTHMKTKQNISRPTTLGRRIIFLNLFSDGMGEVFK